MVTPFFVRAAFCIEKDNKAEAIDKLHLLMADFLRINKLQKKHLHSILFTQTNDIKSFNIARCLREKKGYEHIALFTMQEVNCDESLLETIPRTIRLLIIGHKNFMIKKPVSLYRFGAEKLRPDLSIQ